MGRDHRPIEIPQLIATPQRFGQQNAEQRCDDRDHALAGAGPEPVDRPPSLFGQQFMLTQAGNRYGLPAFYSLHAWVWKDNPDGMFSMYNPAASCEASTP